MEWKYNNTKSSLLKSFKSEEDYLETDRKYTKISHHFLHFKPHTFPIWPKIRKCIGMQIFWNWRGWTAVKYADAHSDLVQGVPIYITICLNMSFNTNLGTQRCPGSSYLLSTVYPHFVVFIGKLYFYYQSLCSLNLES